MIPSASLDGRPQRRADRARRMADVLRRQVLDGLVTDTLPAESILARDFDVTRNTVREALAMLRHEGLVDRIPGIGTVVTGGKLPHRLDRLQGLAETLSGTGRVHNEVRVLGLVPAPTAVARRLDLTPGSDVVYLERRRFADDLPLSLDLTYLVPDPGVGLLGEDLAGRDVFALLEQLGGPLGHAQLALEAVAADAHSAAILDVPTGAPLLMLERLTHLADGRPVDLEFIRFRGDRITMQGLIGRDPTMHHDPEETP